MNFSAVRTIRRGRRNGESGQAFAELAVSLIAILAVLAGFLVVAMLSVDGVTMSIHARENADQLSSNGVSTHAGTSISHWDYGEDTVPFTPDDHAIAGAEGNGGLFKSQLRDPSGRVSLGTSSPLRYDDEFGRLQNRNFFVSAADLAVGSSSSLNSLRDHGIGSLERAVRGLFGVKDVEIRDDVYMPAHKELPSFR